MYGSMELNMKLCITTQATDKMIMEHLTGKGEIWPLYPAVTAYAVNKSTYPALSGFLRLN